MQKSTALRGRPSKLEALGVDQVAQIESLIRAGATTEVAARSVGIDRVTLWRWLQEGERARAGSRARELHVRVERARAQSEAGLIARIAAAAGTGSWGAAAWLLERRFPERWAKGYEQSEAMAPPLDDDDRDPLAEIIDLAKRRRE